MSTITIIVPDEYTVQIKENLYRHLSASSQDNDMRRLAIQAMDRSQPILIHASHNVYNMHPPEEIKCKFFFFIPRNVNGKWYWLTAKNVRIQRNYYYTTLPESSDDVLMYRDTILEVIN